MSKISGIIVSGKVMGLPVRSLVYCSSEELQHYLDKLNVSDLVYDTQVVVYNGSFEFDECEESLIRDIALKITGK